MAVKLDTDFIHEDGFDIRTRVEIDGKLADLWLEGEAVEDSFPALAAETSREEVVRRNADFFAGVAAAKVAPDRNWNGEPIRLAGIDLARMRERGGR